MPPLTFLSLVFFCPIFEQRSSNFIGHSISWGIFENTHGQTPRNSPLGTSVFFFLSSSCDSDMHKKLRITALFTGNFIHWSLVIASITTHILTILYLSITFVPLALTHFWECRFTDSSKVVTKYFWSSSGATHTCSQTQPAHSPAGVNLHSHLHLYLLAPLSWVLLFLLGTSLSPQARLVGGTKLTMFYWTVGIAAHLRGGFPISRAWGKDLGAGNLFGRHSRSL